MKKTFKARVEDKEVELEVRRPDHRAVQDAQYASAAAFKEALGKGAVLRDILLRDLEKQGFWNEETRTKYEQARRRLMVGEKKLAAGGLRLSEARALALDMRVARFEMRQLEAPRLQLDQFTAEAQAENARFNHLVAACTVYSDTGKPFFRDTQDYVERAAEEAGRLAAKAMSELVYGLEDGWEKQLPENKFLLRYRFVDEELRLIDRDGGFIDGKGRRVDGEGRLVNERGEFVDEEGNVLTDRGDFKVEFTPFVDDAGGDSPAQAA
jgi:hypothetical protein